MLLYAVAWLSILAIAAWIAAPLFGKDEAIADASAGEKLSDLLEAKEAVYRSIIDLEFDRRMQKVSEEDYAYMRSQHESEALKILGQIHGAATTDALELEITAARRRLLR